MAEDKKSPQPARGVCRYCGCTQFNPCVRRDGSPCGWWDLDLTVCTRPECVTAHMTANARKAKRA